MRKNNVRLILLLIFIVSQHINCFASDLLEDEISKFQENVDIAIEESNESALDKYLSDSFIFSISGCQKGKFKVYKLSKVDFIKSLSEMESSSSEVISKQRTISGFRIFHGIKKARVISHVTEKSIANKKEKIVISVEDIRYNLDNNKIKIDKMLIEIKEQYQMERDAAGNIIKTYLCLSEE